MRRPALGSLSKGFHHSRPIPLRVASQSAVCGGVLLLTYLHSLDPRSTLADPPNSRNPATKRIQERFADMPPNRTHLRPPNEHEMPVSRKSIPFGRLVVEPCSWVVFHWLSVPCLA